MRLKTPSSIIKLNGKEKICIHAPLHLGDSVMSLPFLKNLRSHYPKIKITLITTTKLAALWRYQPYINEIWTCDSSAKELLKLSLRLKRNLFDAVFLLATGEDVAEVYFKAGIPIRIGYDFWGRGQLLTHYIPTAGFPTDPNLTKKHMVQNYLDLLILISIKPKFYKPKIFWTKKIKPANAEPFRIGVAPGASFGPSKRWPAESFLELCLKLCKVYERIILLGSKEDLLQSTSFFSRVASKQIKNQMGRTTLNQLIEWILRCKLVVANDSGISHLANALGVPTITLFGSSSPTWTKPLDPRSKVISLALPCSPCFDRICRFGHTRCLNRISVNRVYRAARRLL